MPKGDEWKKEIRDLVEALKKTIQRYVERLFRFSDSLTLFPGTSICKSLLMREPFRVFWPSTCAFQTLGVWIRAYPFAISLPRWSPAYREKMAYATAYFILENQVTGKCLQPLLRDVVVKDGNCILFNLKQATLLISILVDVSIDFITTFFKVFLQSQTIEQLGTLLRKSGITDLLAFFPNTKRDRTHLEKHFKAHGLNSVVDYHTKKVNAAVKEEAVARLKEMIAEEESVEDVSLPSTRSMTIRAHHTRSRQMLEYLKTKQAETKVSELDMINAIWLAIMDSIDWNAKPDQLDAIVVKHVNVS